MPAKSKMQVTKSKAKSLAMAAVHEAAQDMANAGLIDQKTMRDYEGVCLEVPKLSAKDVVRIRTKSHVSQGYFARVLNVSPSTVKQWETGAKNPSGLAAKVLTLIERQGLDLFLDQPDARA